MYIDSSGAGIQEVCIHFCREMKLDPSKLDPHEVQIWYKDGKMLRADEQAHGKYLNGSFVEKIWIKHPDEEKTLVIEVRPPKVH